MKYSIILIIFLIGCNDVKRETNLVADKDTIPIYVTVEKHDTVVVNDIPVYTDSTIKELLIEYYKAGWMSAANHLTDLHNDNTLSDKTLKIVRNTDWRKIEYQTRSK